MGQAISQGWPPAPNWTAEDVPDLSGKVIIVTGGNAGIGKETARICLERNATVYIACRSEAKAIKAIQYLKEVTTGRTASFLKLDLADLKSIKLAAAEFIAKERHLHILFNNAGVSAPPIEQLTADGYDLQFGTNVLGHYYFTSLLLPILLSTANSTPSGHVRVVNTSSSVIYLPEKDKVIVWDTLGRDEAAERARTELGTQALYLLSKCGNVLFSNELARRYGDQGIISTSLNPGNVRTELHRHLQGMTAWIVDMALYHVSFGALTQLYAGTALEAEKLNGKFLIPWARVGVSRPELDDPILAEKLWDWFGEQVKDL